MGSAYAARFTPAGLCAITNNTDYESLTLPINIGGDYPQGSTQSIATVIGDTETPTNGLQATTGDAEFVLILLDTNNDGTPEAFTNSSCSYDRTAAPPGCSVTQNITIPPVTEDTTYRGRVMLSFNGATPANGCGNNGFGDSEDFLLVADVQETITVSDVSSPEDGGPITLTAVLSHDVKNGAGFFPFSVDYVLSNGSATQADNDYIGSTGTITFNGQAGDSQNIIVTPVADIVPEGDEDFTLSFQNLTNTTHGIDISDSATITLTEDDTEVALQIAKSVSDITPNIGDTVVFELSVSNAGPDDAFNVSVQDIVPAGLSTITPVSVPAGSAFVVVGSTIDWTGISIPASGSVIASYSAVVLAP